MVNYLSRMNVSLGCDHAGPALKARVAAFLEARGVVAVNRGTDTEDRVDYPDYAHRVAEDVASGSAELGILICGSANGVAMAANKHAGIRAAIAWNAEVARLARGHNDANVLCLPARFISDEEALACVEAFLTTPFEGGRHAGRVAKIALTCALWVLSLAGLHAQTQLEAQRVRGWAATVAPAELEEQLTVFASDAFEGRETGTPGAEKASEFVRDAFAAAGLQPGVSGGWFQDVPMRTEKLVSGSFRISGTAYRFPEDVVFPPSVELEECPETDLFFAGYGIGRQERRPVDGQAEVGRSGRCQSPCGDSGKLLRASRPVQGVGGPPFNAFGARLASGRRTGVCAARVLRFGACGGGVAGRRCRRAEVLQAEVHGARIVGYVEPPDCPGGDVVYRSQCGGHRAGI
jgi:ribose 5-phosphate isomerase B